MDPSTIDRWTGLLDAGLGHAPKPKELTFFDISSRGHYENPLSDLLAFLLDARREHGLGTSVLRALLEALPIDDRFGITDDDLIAEYQVQREFQTRQGNRIDIVANFSTWTLAIETKVWHQQINPFDDYEASIRSGNHGQNQRYLCVLLCPSGISSNKRWTGLSFASLAEAIHRRLEQDHPGLASRWVVLAAELVMHLSNLGRPIMDTTAFAFAAANYHDLVRLDALRRQFLAEIERRCVEGLRKVLPDTVDIRSQIASWGDGPGGWGQVLLFHPSAWNGAYLALALCPVSEGLPAVLLYAHQTTPPMTVATLNDRLGITMQPDPHGPHVPVWWLRGNCASVEEACTELMNRAPIIHAGFTVES